MVAEVAAARSGKLKVWLPTVRSAVDKVAVNLFAPPICGKTANWSSVEVVVLKTVPPVDEEVRVVPADPD